MSKKTLAGMTDSELEACYDEALNKLPSRAPIFLPTERMSLEKKIEGVRRVDHIYKKSLDSVYRPKLKALREKHKGSRRCFIIGNGPSLNDTNLEALKDEVTFAVNGFFLKAEDLSWTPTYYVVEDHLVAEDRLEWINKFKGPTKLFPAYLGYCFEEADDTIFYNHRPRISYPDGFDFSTDAAKITYTGCTVTFSCMQLAHYMGFEEIYLIGVDASYEIPADVDDSDDYNVGVLDMKSDDPNHFHPDYFGKGFRWHDPQVHKMVEAYKEARKVTDGTGRSIYNATVGGKLEVFERVSFDNLFTVDKSFPLEQQKPTINVEDYPRVLIYDITLSGNGTATGEVKSNLLQGWPKDKVGQFYSTGREQFGLNKGGQKIANKLTPQEAIDEAKSFNPDVILYRPVADNLALHKAAMTAITRLDSPLVTWYMDDWPERYKVEDPKRFAYFAEDFEYLIEASNHALVIGEMMAGAYEARHGRKFIPLANGVNVSDWPEPMVGEIKGRPFKIRYAGSLAENMTMNSLLRVAEAVEELSKKYNVVFEIKTIQLWYDKVKAKFKKFTKTSFLVENLSIEDYRGWIAGADTLVIAYNFDARSKLYTRYSVANKMPECLATGVPILAHGPSDVATIELLRKNDCAVLSGEPDTAKVAQDIERLMTSLPLRRRLSGRGREVAFQKHNLADLSPQLKNILISACETEVSEEQVKVKGHAVILGNGPSLRDYNFDKLGGHVVFGMNAAYRHWDKIGWYPDYYSCLDPVVGLSHKAEIRRLIENSSEYGIKKFLLRDNLVRQLVGCNNDDRIVNFDLIRAGHEAMNVPTITTGSHTAAWAAAIGYKELFLLGVDANYVEVVDGAVKNAQGELVIKDQKDNPNYFIDDYQRKGDKYNLPNPSGDIHLQSWRDVKQALDFKDVMVLNTSFSSKVDAFDFCRFEAIKEDDEMEIIDKNRVLGSAKVLSEVVYPREAQAGFDETFLIYKMYEEHAPGIMIDVGAHYGSSARPFAKKEWSVFCQEPDPSNRAHLVKSLGKNNFVKIDPRAVGEAPEKGRVFYSSDESTGISGMLAFRDTHKQSATVDVTTVKDIIAENNIPHINFLKIDVEGYDFGVLKGVPWDEMKPDVIECEFEDAKTKHLGHNWRDICDYLVERDYVVYVSEWHPIVRYGISHDWCALKKYPCELDDVDAWGNLLAFKKDPGEGALCEVLERVMKIRNKDYVHIRPSLVNPAKLSGAKIVEPLPQPQVISERAPFKVGIRPRIDGLSAPLPFSGGTPVSDSLLSASSQQESFADRLRRQNPVLFRVAQVGNFGLQFIKRHVVLAVLGFFLVSSLILAPSFFEPVKPYAVYFWIAALGILGVAGAFIGVAIANVIANRLAVREKNARQALKNEILRTVEHHKKMFDHHNQHALSEIEATSGQLSALADDLTIKLEERLSAEVTARNALLSIVDSTSVDAKNALELIAQKDQEDAARDKFMSNQSEQLRLRQNMMRDSLSAKIEQVEHVSKQALSRVNQETKDSVARYMVAQENIEAEARERSIFHSTIATSLNAKVEGLTHAIEGRDLKHLQELHDLEIKLAELKASTDKFRRETRKKIGEDVAARIDLKNHVLREEVESMVAERLNQAEDGLRNAKTALEDEIQARSVLTLKISEASKLSKTALARVDKEKARNSTSFMQAQEQLEGRLLDRLKSTEKRLLVAQKALEKETKARSALAKKISETSDLSNATIVHVSEKMAANNSSFQQTSGLISTLKEELEQTKKNYDITQRQIYTLEDSINKASRSLMAANADKQAQIIALEDTISKTSQSLTAANADKQAQILALEDTISKTSQSLTAANADKQAQILALEDTISKTSQSLIALNVDKGVEHQPFNRVLSRQHIDVLKKDWLKPLNLTETDRSLAYMADRIRHIEKNLKGRLATSIEDAVLRTLIAKAVTGKGLKVLEIGVLFGIGLAMIHDRTKDLYEQINVTALDPFEGYYGDEALDIVTQERVTKKAFIENMNLAHVPNSDFTVIEGYSADDNAIKMASKFAYDVLIIDGDHSYAGVKSDFVNYAPMVKRGGYILIDDDSSPEWPEITKFVDDELLPLNEITLIGRSFRTAAFKVIKKIKA